MVQNLSSRVESVFKEKRLLAGSQSGVQCISEAVKVQNFKGFNHVVPTCQEVQSPQNLYQVVSIWNMKKIKKAFS